MSMTMQAPGALELVRRFVNTADLDRGTDALADPALWAQWCTEVAGLPGMVEPGPASEEDLARLRVLRESLRGALLAHHDRAPLPGETLAAFGDALAWAAPMPRLDDTGLRLRPQGGAPARLAGAVLDAVGVGLADGTFARLKSCRRDTCRWAFYDNSRSRTGQWCSMSGCGNQAKQERWRARR